VVQIDRVIHALLICLHLAVQATAVRIEVRTGDVPVAGATVSAAGASATTDASGIARLAIPRGKTGLAVQKDGFVAALVSIDVSGAPDQVVRVDLQPEPTHEEEVTVVASTRTGRRVEDQPARVEVLGREEIEEKMLMTPGDIVMMLNEMGGLRVQATSPSLGAASVRIQGMRGRYTRFLSDGLPLFGQQPGGLGLLQIPPMDLGQVEVIKGVASALYGAGAMGGVVNLLSRRPGDAFASELLVNRSTRSATDGVLWLESPLSGRWGLTLLGSAHAQSRTDVDDDGWADLPGYTRGVVRPRLFWDDGAGRSFFATAGATWEDRTGGTQAGAVLPATGLPYREALTTRRFDAGLVGQTLVAQRFVLAVRGAFARQTHRHEFGEHTERDRHLTSFAEATVRGAAGAHTWVAGLAIEDDRYRPTDLPQFAYGFTTPGVFVQDDVDVRPWLTVSASARVDRHSEYGWFLSPRGSALLRGGEWTARVSAGTGFFGPTPLTEETEAAGLSRLTIDGPLRAERGRGLTVDLTREIGPASVTGTFFTSRIRDAMHVDRETFTLRSLASPVTNTGGEVLALFRRAPFVVTGTYTYVRARERDGDGTAADVPLTPRHSVGIVAMAESEDAGRVGLEIYVTGRQRLEANPYRETSEPYVIVGLLAERRVGRLRLFINGENLTGMRQSRWDPLLRPARAADGRWTVDAWAPLEGRVVNGGVRVMF
jgi:iron complex outermembrane receptor protein